MNNAEIKEVITAKMNQYGTSIKGLAERLNIPYLNLYHSLSNSKRDRKLRPEELVAICNFYDLDIIDFTKEGADNASE